MTRDDITRMAREAGYGWSMTDMHAPALERFAALVAAAERKRIESRPWGAGEEWIARAVAAEREACAMEADYEAARWPYAPECREPCEEIAKAIRARGEK
jgi:hypothetical protein